MRRQDALQCVQHASPGWELGSRSFRCTWLPAHRLAMLLSLAVSRASTRARAVPPNDYVRLPCDAVIDVYTATWGPCEMVAGHFQNYFYDLGETLGIKFVRAEADKITALKEYAGAASSTFLMYLVRRQRRNDARARPTCVPARAARDRAAADAQR